MSNKQIAHPLQALVKRAAATLPATTGRTEAMQQQLARRAGATVILADVSASMASFAADGRRKIDVLRDSVAAAKGRARLVAFSAEAREVEQVPEPESHTNLAGALEHVRALDPGTTLVISDGEPDNEAAALAVARTFRGAIDVLYIGDKSNTRAVDFMRRLAASAGGRVTINDIAQRDGVQLLQQRIAGLLAGPGA